MKKKMGLILVLVLVCGAFSGIAVQAATGDVTGNIYATDIKACINGVWVDSYNIGGKTVVIVEDITTQFSYYDAVRTLVIEDLNPEYLSAGESTNTQNNGTPVGNIYETDIKTFFRGKELASYSLNGKMAIVLEELGADNTFSDIGGKYVWNPASRTIVLESMHRYPYAMRTMMEEKNYNIVLTEQNGVLEAEPVQAPLTGGHILCEKEIPENSIIRVAYKGETIGYRCMFPETVIEKDESGKYASRERQAPVDYFYVDKVEDMIFQAVAVTPTADDWRNYFENYTVSTIKDSFETDEYLFLYMFSSFVMSGKDRLIKIDKTDGTKTEYQDFDGLDGPKHFEKVEIDRENEKVYVRGYGDYVIDLKTDAVRAYNKLETDIGVGSDAGQPSEYNATCARNSQQDFRLVSGDEEKIVRGFSIPEYYYAYMLPLDETFNFLNINYSFENDVLTIDTSNAKSFYFEDAGEKSSLPENEPIKYLYVDKVLLDGEESKITYSYISGHFQNTYSGRAEAQPYVCNGKVYINTSFIRFLCGKE